MTNPLIPPRLRWACRRGMLELDIFLGKFLEGAYPTLSSDDQLFFEKLLTLEDQDLFEWLTGKKNPLDPDVKAMIQQIQRYVKQSHTEF